MFTDVHISFYTYCHSLLYLYFLPTFSWTVGKCNHIKAKPNQLNSKWLISNKFSKQTLLVRKTYDGSRTWSSSLKPTLSMLNGLQSLIVKSTTAWSNTSFLEAWWSNEIIKTAIIHVLIIHKATITECFLELTVFIVGHSCDFFILMPPSIMTQHWGGALI